jgi:hypothetical protein
MFCNGWPDLTDHLATQPNWASVMEIRGFLAASVEYRRRKDCIDK